MHFLKSLDPYTVLRIRIQSDPYDIGSPGSGSVYKIRIRIQQLKTDPNLKNLEYFINFFQICLKFLTFFKGISS